MKVGDPMLNSDAGDLNTVEGMPMDSFRSFRAFRTLLGNTANHMLVFTLCFAWMLSACSRGDFDFEQLFVSVFVPQSGEKVLIVVDNPTSDIPDNPAWEDRRAMAEEWWSTLQGMEKELGIELLPLASYEATGIHNAPLPGEGLLGGVFKALDAIVPQANFVIAMTEYSATAPMMEFTATYPDLRVASMPMVTRSMQGTALAANYSAISDSCNALRDRLDRAIGAEVEFSTGHQLYIDLRHRIAEVDDGKLDGSPGSARVINLPSGEAYIAPYEGELEGDPSQTHGLIPVRSNPEIEDSYVVVVVEANRIVEVQAGTAPEFAIEGRA